MEQLSNLPQTLLQPLEALFTKVAEFAPNILGALFMLIVGYLFAKFVAFVLNKLFIRIGINRLSDKVGISSALEKSGIKKTFSALVGRVVFWMIMLTFVISASDTLGLERVSSTIDDLILYLPKVFAAAIVLLIGLFVANFVRKAIATGTSSMNAEYGAILSKSAHGLLVVVSAVLAVDQLDIDVTLLNHIIQIVLISVAVAVMLSMGLGTREISAGVMSGIYIRDLYKVGTKVEFDNISGTIEQVGTTKTLVAAGGILHSIPNKQLLNSVVIISS